MLVGFCHHLLFCQQFASPLFIDKVHNLLFSHFLFSSLQNHRTWASCWPCVQPLRSECCLHSFTRTESLSPSLWQTIIPAPMNGEMWAQPVYVCKISLPLYVWSQNWLFLCLQFVLVSVGDAIIASSPAPLCDGESHEIQVTISGNQTLLLVDGQLGRSEDTEVPVDVLSQSSTFIGGLPGEDTFVYTFCRMLFIQYVEGLQIYK